MPIPPPHPHLFNSDPEKGRGPESVVHKHQVRLRCHPFVNVFCYAYLLADPGLCTVGTAECTVLASTHLSGPRDESSRPTWGIVTLESPVRKESCIAPGPW